MSYVTANRAIRLALKQWWEAEFPTIELAWDNADFTVPADTWVRVFVIPGSTTLAGLGGDLNSRLWRIVGVLSLQVFTPNQEGTAEAERIADRAITNLQGQTINDVLFREVSMTRFGETGDWHQTNVSVPYQFDYYG